LVQYIQRFCWWKHVDGQQYFIQDGWYKLFEYECMMA